jgi:hypothetical protein
MKMGMWFTRNAAFPEAKATNPKARALGKRTMTYTSLEQTAQEILVRFQHN